MAPVVSWASALLHFGHPASSGWSMTNSQTIHLKIYKKKSFFLFRMLWSLVVCVGLVVGQEVTDEVLDNINEPSGIALKYYFALSLSFYIKTFMVVDL